MYFLCPVYFPGFQAIDQFLRGQVYIYHLVRFFQNLVGNPFLYFNSGNSLDVLVQTFDMLDVYSRYHVNARLQKVHYVLPPFGISAAIHVGMRKLVHDYQLRMQLKNGIQIHLFQFFSLVENLLAGNDGQSFQQRFCTGTSMRLHITNLYVNSVVQHFMSFLQHLVRLSDAGNHADIDFENTSL